jgi:FkbM family methyltransferase
LWKQLFGRVLRQIAKAIRHHPMLEGADGLWNVLRKPYHLVLSLGGRGTKVSVGSGNRVTIRVPPDLSGWSFEEYESKTIDALSQWIKRYPGGLVIDIGSFVGFFSASAMFLDPTAKVVALDSDIESVPATRRFCQYAPTPSRLTTIHGLITNDAPLSSLTDAVSQTEAKVIASGARGTFHTMQFVHLHSASEDLPRYRLDDLFSSAIDRPILIKCDVEGAELLVLRGASRLLSEMRCDLLLSVHWHEMTERYGYTVEDIRKFLNDLDYQIEVLAIDHEEHWWCTPAQTAPADEASSTRNPLPLL